MAKRFSHHGEKAELGGLLLGPRGLGHVRFNWGQPNHLKRRYHHADQRQQNQGWRPPDSPARGSSQTHFAKGMQFDDHVKPRVDSSERAD
jgi:hypothetical protein